VVMLEGGGREVPEAEVAQAIALAEVEARPALDAVRRLQERAGRKKRTARQATENARAPEAFERAARERVLVALAEPEKHARALALHRARTDLGHAHDVPHDEARSWFDAVTRRVMREELLEGRRIGGRGLDEVRPISGRTGWLPRCHGSALFTRGETQAVCTCTLGTARDAQRVETMDGQREERFLLHYAFPPYSVGEARPLRGPGRREIGHGHLARRALVPVLRPDDLQTYTIRVESTITESNGSSSMATVCGGSLALLDAGIELVRPVAGIAMGLVKDGDRVSILSDILGDEDHIGDMDFKVAGTEVGITAIQLDNKLGSLPADLTAQALEQARAGRLQILERMAEIRGEAREGGGRHAPRAVSLRIDPNRVGDLIGPGGRNIKSVEALGGKVGVEDDGSVRLFAKEQDVLDAMRVRVEALTQIPMLGGMYEAQVVTVKSFGCFVRIFEGVDGLLPGCERKEGERVQIEVCGVNDKGKLVLREAAAAASS